MSGTFADAFAIGATGVTAWALAKATPAIRDAASRAQQMMDYAESQQQAVKVVNRLGEAIDTVLESAETTRPVFILGYSMGALVAFDYLCPRKSQLELTDDRHVDAIRALITIGSPLDFVRLYLPQYIAQPAASCPRSALDQRFHPCRCPGLQLHRRKTTTSSRTRNRRSRSVPG